MKLWATTVKQPEHRKNYQIVSSSGLDKIQYCTNAAPAGDLRQNTQFEEAIHCMALYTAAESQLPSVTSAFHCFQLLYKEVKGFL